MKLLLILLLSTPYLLSNGVDFYSKKFLNIPYGFSPLGEGFGIDKEPRYREDLFDCTTYVETVLAHTTNTNDYLTNIDLIRYKGNPSFYNRRHFPYFWLNGLINEGYLKPYKTNYDKTITKTINKDVWAKRKPKFLPNFDVSQIPEKTYVLSYVPLKDLAELKITEPLIFSLVREDRESSPILITHQGFLIPTPNGVVVRHARSKPVNKVVEEPFEVFIKRSSSYKKWKVLGLNLVTPENR